MESTRNLLPRKCIKFFNKLSEYLDKKLLFYGSVQRLDYIAGYSDIDVDIFTDNVDSTLSKMQHFLNLSKPEFKKIIWKLNVNNQVVYGYKVMYKNTELNLTVEFSIYNNKYKKGVLEEHLKKMILPFYISIMLYILKLLYYRMNLIPKNLYTYTKQKILSYIIGLPEDKFVAIK